MTLTAKDLKLIAAVVGEIIDNNSTVAKKSDLEFLPTKEEFYEQTDKIMGKLKAIREEHQMLSSRVYDDHEPRIEKLEKKLNLQPTA